MVQATGCFGGTTLHLLVSAGDDACSVWVDTSDVEAHALISIKIQMVAMKVLKCFLCKVSTPGHAAPNNGDQDKTKHDCS